MRAASHRWHPWRWGPTTWLSCYCAESATGDWYEWRRYLHNIVRLLAPGGLFITAALRRCKAYCVGHRRFACADIDEHDLAAVLQASGFAPAQMHFEVQTVGLRERLGYDSIVLATARASPTGDRSGPPAARGALPSQPRPQVLPSAGPARSKLPGS